MLLFLQRSWRRRLCSVNKTKLTAFRGSYPWPQSQRRLNYCQAYLSWIRANGLHVHCTGDYCWGILPLAARTDKYVFTEQAICLMSLHLSQCTHRSRSNIAHNSAVTLASWIKMMAASKQTRKTNKRNKKGGPLKFFAFCRFLRATNYLQITITNYLQIQSVKSATICKFKFAEQNCRSGKARYT